MPSILAQAFAPAIIPVYIPIIIAIGAFLYALYKSGKGFVDSKHEAESAEFRKMFLGMPTLVMVMTLVALNLVTLNLTAIFGVAAFLVEIVLALTVPLLTGLVVALPLIFVIAMGKKELKYPGI